MKYRNKMLIVVLLLGLVVCAFLVYNVFNVFTKPNTSFNNNEAFVYIPSGANLKTVGQELEPLLIDVESFYKVALRLQYEDKLKPGKYVIKKEMSNAEIVQALMNEDEKVNLVIPKRRKIKDLANIISNQIEANENDVYRVLTDTMYFSQKGFSPNLLDVVLISNSYKIPWNTSAEEFRSILLQDAKKRNN